MKQPPFVALHWPHVPEPREIVAWLARLPAWVKAYWRRREVQLGWGVALFGALLRLAQPGLAPLGTESVAYLAQAEEILAALRGQAPSVPLAVTAAQPSWFSHFLTLPLLLSRDPRWMVAFFGMLNVLAVALIFGIGRRFFSLRCACVASLFLATAPWAVTLARRLAPEALLIPLSAAILASLYSAVRGDNPWAWALAYLLAGLTLLIFPEAWPLALALLIISALFWRRIRWPYAALGMILFLLMATHYLYGLASRQPEGLAALWQGEGQDGAGGLRTALRLAGGLHAGWGLGALAAPSAAQFALQRAPFAWAGRLLLLLWALSLPGVFWLALRSWSRWREGQDAGTHLLVAAWNLTPWLAWLVRGHYPETPVQMAYVLPGGLLGMGILVDWLLDAPHLLRWRRYRWMAWAYPAMWALVAVMTLWNTYATAYLSRFAAERDVHLGYGIPYRYWEQTVRSVQRALPASNADQVWIVASDDTQRQAGEATVLPYLLAPTVESVVVWQRPAAVLLPAERPAVYVLAGSAPWAEGLTAYLGGQDIGVVLLPGGQGETRIRMLEARTAEEMLALAPVRALRSFDAGLHLAGYEWPTTARAGETAVIGTYWTFWDVPEAERGRSHHLALALVDAAGREAVRTEGLAITASEWQEGLLLKQWHPLDLAHVPAGDYVLTIALDREGGPRSLYVDERGQPLGSAFALGPVSVAAP